MPAGKKGKKVAPERNAIGQRALFKRRSKCVNLNGILKCKWLWTNMQGALSELLVAKGVG
jgi:hypothetical protein